MFNQRNIIIVSALLLSFAADSFASSDNEALFISGQLQPQATIVVISKTTNIVNSSNYGAVPGLAGNRLEQKANIEIDCTNSMVLEMMLNSQNNFILRDQANPNILIPYQVDAQHGSFSSYNKTPSRITASVICKGNRIQIPINISTARMPYSLSNGSYRDTIFLNLTY